MILQSCIDFSSFGECHDPEVMYTFLLSHEPYPNSTVVEAGLGPDSDFLKAQGLGCM